MRVKNFSVAGNLAANAFDLRCAILLASKRCDSLPRRAGRSAPRLGNKVLERRNRTNRFGLVRVLCFILGRGRVLRPTRPLVDCACVPTISLFDPPTYTIASLRDVLASFRHGESPTGETRLRDGRTSTAAAPQGFGQDVC
jgi:hypothetical protein